MEKGNSSQEIAAPNWVVASGADPETGVAWAVIEPGSAKDYVSSDYPRIDEITILLRGKEGDVLGFTTEEYDAFLCGAKNNEFDI